MAQERRKAKRASSFHRAVRSIGAVSLAVLLGFGAAVLVERAVAPPSGIASQTSGAVAPRTSVPSRPVIDEIIEQARLPRSERRPEPENAIAPVAPSGPILARPKREVDPPAWLRHAVPFDGPADAPKLAIVLLVEGQGAMAFGGALALDLPLTFALRGDENGMQGRAMAARNAGAELLALIPRETGLDVPPPVNGLSPHLPGAEILRRVRWHVAQTDEALGAVMTPSTEAPSRPITEALVAALVVEDLVLLDTYDGLARGAGAFARLRGVPTVDGSYAEDVVTALETAERAARDWGGAALALPLSEQTVDDLRVWLGARDRAVLLAPLSAVLLEQRAPLARANTQ